MWTFYSRGLKNLLRRFFERKTDRKPIPCPGRRRTWTWCRPGRPLAADTGAAWPGRASWRTNWRRSFSLATRDSAGDIPACGGSSSQSTQQWCQFSVQRRKKQKHGKTAHHWLIDRLTDWLINTQIFHLIISIFLNKFLWINSAIVLL